MRIELGRLVSTEQVADWSRRSPAAGIFVLESLGRHAKGDWGDLCEEDRAMNERAVTEGGRLFSAYVAPDKDKTKIWVITEADRSVTTVLFLEDY